MKFKELFCKLGEVPGLDLKKKNKNIIFPLYYAFLRFCGMQIPFTTKDR